MNNRLLYNMTHRDNVSLLCSLKFVTLLAVLSPELSFLGAGVQLKDNGYDGLLVAINPQVPENQDLVPNIKEMITEASFYLFNATKRRVFFRNIQILIPATWKVNNYSQIKQESYEKANVIVTDWNGVNGDDPYTLQYRGCGKEGKYIHFTSNFLLNDDLTAGYGSRGRVFAHEWAHLRWGVFDEYNNDKPFYLDGQNKIKATSSTFPPLVVSPHSPRQSHESAGSSTSKAPSAVQGQHGVRHVVGSQKPPVTLVVEFCNASTHNQEAPNLQNQMCSLRSAWDILVDSSDFSHSFPMNGTELPPPPTFSVVQAGDKVVCLVLDVSSKMAELESTSENVEPYHQLKNTVTVDSSVGNDTTFLVTWQISGPPEIVLSDPTGRKYYTNNFITSLASQTSRLYIAGTAKPGHWACSLNNTHHSPQVLTVTVASRASSSTVPPVTVEVFVEKDSIHFPDPVTIYANVKKGLYPILNATVTAVIEPETGDPIMLKLLDDGAGADVIKNDGIYSRYFFSFAVNGRYSLKVHVSRSPSVSTLVHPLAGSHAMYVPGYIANGNIQMNAPRKSAHRSEEEQKWGFSRVSSGGSFSVRGVPDGSRPDAFPPCKIIDLEAVKVEEEVTLSWTAPGEDFDQGQATSYEIRVSKSLQSIRDDFNNAILVNTSKLNPQQAGTREIFTFLPRSFTNEPEYQPESEAQENHRMYVAIRAIDRNSLKSAVSNIAQVSLSSPLSSASASGRDHLILKGVLTAMTLIGIICFVIVVIHYTLNKKKGGQEKEWDEITMNTCTEYLPS
ncbi:calcium-activated chloride channel regulator 2 [Octodon degus]|uniref:Calcium-activated chloride channel regulator 2 n=1 Tax=Octodon degus TaxID=10160 RepID=A0A6P3VD29_OCTDE|nr:calcium-activated chloride channel regulator 2 [Octodon degus]